MSLQSWRIRRFLRQLPPRTPLKRWLYGLGAVLSLMGLAVSPAAFTAALAVLFAIRVLDMRLHQRRRLRQIERNGYFFEGAPTAPTLPD